MKSIYKIEEEIIRNKKRRRFGAHLTSIDIFKEFILPEIKEHIWEYSWIDLFAGEGNLVLPLLECVELEKRIKFFKEHIFLFDIQEQMVKKAISNAEKYGVPYNIAKKNIQKRDTLKDYPEFIKTLKYPPFHITNPPYLYLGYIQKKAISNAEKYGVPYNIAKKNIQKRDTLKDYPEFIKTLKYPRLFL
ncbi:unnamed protein product [marine sediment metagenome]|uniref:Uncharacterized protein n=1 Tax=marine sediment metagenome TaxID=412755 RepID=X1JK77_9ZZZZ